ncbi:MAG: hypothetical protein ACYCO9_11570 [Streptosporangiaceae bacterium]
MTAAGLAAYAWAAIVVASLLGIVGFFLIAASTSVLTVLRSGRRARAGRARARSPLIRDLAHGCAPDDLADIDDALRRVLAEEHGREPSRFRP